MTPDAVLLELLDRLAALGGSPVHVSDEELAVWPGEAVDALRRHGLLVEAGLAKTTVCPGCEYACTMLVNEVVRQAGDPDFFVYCDRRADIGKVDIPKSALKLSAFTGGALGRFIARSLGLNERHASMDREKRLELGIAGGAKRSQMLCLSCGDPITLLAGNVSNPAAGLVRFNSTTASYEVDTQMVRQLVDAGSTANRHYTPSQARREVRKAVTQKVHEGWRREYQRLHKMHPHKSDSWVAIQISKGGLSAGRSAETIRRYMKP